MTTKRGLGREQVYAAAWTETYPHPLLSCMMPVVALLGVMVVVLFALQLWQITLPRDTIIPQIEGLKVEQAIADLHRAGLSAEVLKDHRSSETIPEDAVISALPAGGRRVKMGRKVQLTLSAGSAYSMVPDVRELPQSVADDRIMQAGLGIAKEEYQFNPTIPANRVITISPKPGLRVKRLSTVDIVLSKGAEQAANNTAPAAPQMRTVQVAATLPTDADGPEQVRIDVTDNAGTRTVYQQDHQPGEKINQSVQGTGKITVDVYFGDQLVLSKKY